MITANIITDLSDRLNDWANNWWFLGVIAVIALLDSIIPIVPSESAVIVAGVAAASDAPYSIWMVILCGATGAFLGDNIAYFIGRWFAPAFQRRAARKAKFAERLEWADKQIEERGGLLLITARFIPGGRTLLTLTSGITQQPRTWFTRWIAIAVVIWASYAALLGRIGGETFKDSHTKAFMFAFGLAITATILIEVVRHFIKRRTQHDAEATLPTSPTVESSSSSPTG